MLEVDSLAVRLPGGGPDWTGLSMTVEPGAITLLAGPNGCGTSTLLAAVTGHLPAGSAVSGRIAWRGRPLDARPDELGGVVARVADAARPDEATGADLLRGRHRPRAARRHADRERAALVDRLGLADHLDRPLRACPHAVRARVRLAAALLERPSLLVADQLLGTQPAAWRPRVAALLRERADAGLGVLWADHELDDAWPVADTVVEVGRRGTAATPAGSWRPATVARPILLALADELGVRLDRRTGRLGGPVPDLSPVLPAARPVRGEPAPPLDPARARIAGERIDLRAGEVVGVLGDDDRLTARLARAWARDATGRPTDLALDALLADLPLGEAVARWVGGGPTPTLRHLARATPGLRPAAPLADHSQGEAAAVRAGLARTADQTALVEPTRGLDVAARRRLARDLADRGRAGATTVVATGDVELAVRTCTRLVVVENGALVDLGTPRHWVARTAGGSAARGIPLPRVARALGQPLLDVADARAARGERPEEVRRAG